MTEYFVGTKPTTLSKLKPFLRAGHQESAILPPGGFALLLDATYSNVGELENVLNGISTDVLLFTTESGALSGSSQPITTTGDTQTLFYLIKNSNTSESGAFPASIGASLITPLPLHSPKGTSLELASLPQGEGTDTSWGIPLAERGHSAGKINSLRGSLTLSQPNQLSLALLPGSKKMAGLPIAVELIAKNAEGKTSVLSEKRITIKHNGELQFLDWSFLLDAKKLAKEISFTMKKGRSGVFYITAPYSGTFELNLNDGEHSDSKVKISFDEVNLNCGELIISEILFNTLEGKNILGEVIKDFEFIEILNRGENALSLAGWSLSLFDDSEIFSHAPSYPLPEATLLPKETLLLTTDRASLIALFQNLPATTFEASRRIHNAIPSLNNEGGAFLRDDCGQVVDVIKWADSWIDKRKISGGVNGKPTLLQERRFISLEREDPSLTGVAKWNWVASLSPSTEIQYQRDGRDNVLTTVFATPLVYSMDLSESEIEKNPLEFISNPFVLDRNAEQVPSFLVRSSTGGDLLVSIVSTEGKLLIAYPNIFLEKGVNTSHFLTEIPKTGGLYFITAALTTPQKTFYEKSWFVIKD